MIAPPARILVTGAGGFIGSHLAEALVRRGYGVRALVRTNARQSLGWLDDSPADVRDAIEVVWGDVRDADAAADAARGVDAAVHLAAYVSIPYSYARPAETVDVNVMGTLRVARAALAAGARLFVHTSTSEVYGTAQRVPMDEGHPIRPQSPYAASKVAADQIVAAFARTYGLPAVTLRPFNTYGPRQSPRAVIPLLVAQLIAADRVRLGSLEPRRDFTYVDDTVRAFVLLLEHAQDALGKTLHFGSGRAVSIGELLEIARRATGRDVPVETDTARIRPEESEVMHLEADATAFRALTGWTPRVRLEEGLRRTAEWLRTRPDVRREVLRAL